MSRTPSMPEEPTLADIARHVVALHDCIHEGQQQQAADTAELTVQLREHRHESRNNATKVQAQLGDMNGRVSYLEGVTKMIGKTVGAPTPSPAGTPDPKVPTRLLRAKPWQVASAIAVGLAGATGGYKIVAAALIAFHKAMLGAG